MLCCCIKFCLWELLHYNIMVIIVLQTCLNINMGVSTLWSVLQSSPLAFLNITLRHFVLYCKQIANCNVNVLLNSGGVHLGITCCQYGSLPQPHSSLEPSQSEVHCLNSAGNYQDCVCNTLAKHNHKAAV